MTQVPEAPTEPTPRARRGAGLFPVPQQGVQHAYRYTLPEDDVAKGHAWIDFVRTDILSATIQYLSDGSGEPNLHSHDTDAIIYFVLRGTLLFQDAEGHTRELTQHNLMYLPPGGTTYNFLAKEGEEVEFFRVAVKDARLETLKQPFLPAHHVLAEEIPFST